MKLSELLINQKITIQLLWGEQKIEFPSNVIENSEAGVFVSPYLHNGSALELNIKNDKGVSCNVYALNNRGKHRILWKNVELTTIKKGVETVYLLKTSSFNQEAKQADRRLHERVVVRISAQVTDTVSKNITDVLLYDISDIGISFYANSSFTLQSQLFELAFSDTVGGKAFNVRVVCSVARMVNSAGNMFVGCRVVEENREFQIYSFMLRLMEMKKSNDTGYTSSET